MNAAHRYQVGAGAEGISRHRLKRAAKKAAQTWANTHGESITVVDRHTREQTVVKPRARKRRKRSSGGMFGGLFG